MVSEGLAGLLRPDYDVVAIVQDRAQLLRTIDEFVPDLLILDPSRSKGSATAMLNSLSAVSPGLRILTLDGPLDSEMLPRMIHTRCSGIISRDASFHELRLAIESMLQDGAGSAPLKIKSQDSSGERPRIRRLTPRQREILELIARGFTSKEIATTLGVSYHTVHFHRKTLRRVLGIYKDLDLYKYALREGARESTPPLL